MAWNSIDPRVYVVNADGSADWEGDWIPCGPGSLLIIQVAWSAVALTVGLLGLQGTQDPDQAVAIPPDISRVLQLNPTTGIWGAWPDVGASAQSGAVVCLHPFRFMRLIYSAGGGGDVNQFQAWRELRSA